MNLGDLEARIETIVREAGPSGLHKNQLEALREAPSAINQAVSKLITSRRIEMVRNRDNDVILVIMSASGGLSETAALVLDAIKSSGAEGIDAMGIASKTKTVRIEITKALKTLSDKGLLEETRSFTNKAKKVFIIAGLAPSAAVTGGVFYTSNDDGGKNKSREIDFAFVDGIRTCILDLVDAKVVVSSLQMKTMLDNQSLPKILAQKEVESVARTLELDGLLERISPAVVHFCLENSDKEWVSAPPTPQGAILYRRASPSQSILTYSSLGKVTTVATQYPGLSCPLIDYSLANGLGCVNPTNSSYINDWLRLE